MSESNRTTEQEIVAAVLYAVRCGCFFPVLDPQPGWSVQRLTRWGAMRNLHQAIAEHERRRRQEPNRSTHSERRKGGC
jgi:hypothetical protein